jgi:hypothetical protein
MSPFSYNTPSVSSNFLCVSVVIIILHELGLDKPVLLSSNGLFKGLATRLRLFDLKFSITFWHPVFSQVPTAARSKV